MTIEESHNFIDKLKNGYRFITRFQENEWGINYTNPDFLKWSSENEMFTNSFGEMDCKQKYSENNMTEDELVDFLVKNYSYDVMIKKLKPIN
mgnify:CR=1 FL=1